MRSFLCYKQIIDRVIDTVYASMLLNHPFPEYPGPRGPSPQRRRELSDVHGLHLPNRPFLLV